MGEGTVLICIANPGGISFHGICVCVNCVNVCVFVFATYLDI